MFDDLWFISFDVLFLTSFIELYFGVSIQFSLTFLQRCFCSWNRTNKSGKHLNQPFCAFLYPCYTVPRRVWQLFGFGKQVSTTPAFDRPWPRKDLVVSGHNRMHAWYHGAIVVDANWHWTSKILRHLFVVIALDVVIFIPVPLEHIFHWRHFQTGKQVLHGSKGGAARLKSK